MRWKRTLQLVDVHCEGEVGRVVTGGVLDVPGETMAAKLNHINTVDDSMRRLLTSEPRGGPAGSVVLLTPPTRKDADAGLIILQADQAHAMSGSNSMCAVTAMIETGMVPVSEPETIVTFDTAAGLVRAAARVESGKCQSVSLMMPAAYVESLDDSIETEAWGEISFDIAFGGVFYALVDVEQVGLEIESGSARDLAERGVALLQEINSQRRISHPDIPEINGVAYLMFRKKIGEKKYQTCTVLKPGRVDRSPCGTGSTANLVSLCTRGQAGKGDIYETESIIGSRFISEAVDVDPSGDRPILRNRVTGRCWVYGITQTGLDPEDPFQEGFLVADTWGRGI